MLTSQDSDILLLIALKEKDFYIKAIRDQGFIGNKGWPNDKSEVLLILIMMPCTDFR